MFNVSSSRYKSTSRQENVFSGKLTNLAVGLYEIQWSLSESNYCPDALYSPSLIMTTHRRIYSSASISINSRLPICGYTHWSNVAGFVGLFTIIQWPAILREIDLLHIGRPIALDSTHSLTHLRNSGTFNIVNSLIMRCVFFSFRVCCLYTLRYSVDMHRQPVGLLPTDETVISFTHDSRLFNDWRYYAKSIH